MQFKLANILLRVDDFLENDADLLMRPYGPEGACIMRYNSEGAFFEFGGAVDLLSFFNALPLAKWRQYASLDNVWVHLELAGDECDVALQRAYQGHFGKSVVRSQTVHSFGVPEGRQSAAAQDVPEVTAVTDEGQDASELRTVQTEDGWQAIDIRIPFDDAVLVGLLLVSAGTTRARRAFFATEVDPQRIRPVRIALATTTFNNEDFVIPNIELVRSHILEGDEPISRAFHMFVVDNGRTLDAPALSEGGVTVLPNPNVGGSGGFARGMLAALDGEDAPEGTAEPFTHVLLMDDDVRVSPESFIRTFNLLSLVNNDYADAFVQGAMLKLQEPNKQFEDVSFVKRLGGYQAYKETLDVSKVPDLVTNECMPIEGHEGSYGAWWFSCVPVSAIRERGLPLPLFIRIDDAEYGVRRPATFMAMSGICVWHSHFVGRFRPSVDLYQYGRNMLVAIATSGICKEGPFMAKYWRNFQTYIRFLAYEKADLWLDALEHYLEGPEWLASVDGAQLMKSNAERNERMLPLDELGEEDRRIVEQVYVNPRWIDEDGNGERPVWWLAAEALPYDRHRFPARMLRDDPGVVYYADTMSPWYETAMRSVLVAVDNTGEKFHVRRLDEERYRALMRRARSLKAAYKARGPQVSQAYQQAAQRLTSPEFWRSYLGI